MPLAPSITVDWSRKQDVLQVLPQSPILSSQSLGWSSIQVQHHRQPAWECPEHTFHQHVISVHHFAETAQSLRRFAGQVRTESLGEGDVVVMPAGVPHWNRWDRPGEFTLLILQHEHLTRTAAENLDSRRVEILPQFSRKDRLIESVGEALYWELRAGVDASRLYVDSLASALAHHLLRIYSSCGLPRESHSPLTRQELRRAIEVINDRLADNLTLAEIAAAVHMSEHHFARVFKNALGTSPHQYLIRRRVNRTQELLRTTNLSIQEIAWRVGFSNQSHFTAHFRKLLGCTPKAYRLSP